jgi:hypothetical protein
MRKIVVLAALLLWPCVQANALHLGEAHELLKKTNEEVVANIFEDRLAAQVVSMIQKGEKVSPEAREVAKRYCADTLAQIATPKLRKKMVRYLMAQIDREIEEYVARPDGFDDFDGRMLSARIARRLRSLLDFEAERYREFLNTLDENS